jgi:L-ascorbate metabolism protein UlaG (beta-lactamase superfamily)
MSSGGRDGRASPSTEEVGSPSPAALPLVRSKQPPARPQAYWLGQAGFLIESATARILIDPYLSDSLAAKYKGTPRPHIRMMDPPAAPGELRDIDLVIATHGHSDHLDPGSLGPLAEANPGCAFIAPASVSELAVSRGVPRERLIGAQAFASMEASGVGIHPIPAAHESLAIDDHGRFLCLGYVIELDGVSLFHPGDCVPYPGLLDNLAPFSVDLALLPVNGRDAERTAAGVPGNFSLDEAIELAEKAGFRAVLGHHFGMFDFNTIDEAAARAALASRSVGRGAVLPFDLARMGLRYEVAARSDRRQSRFQDARMSSS